jgi:CBS-domain-containing membrane protein
VTRFDLLGLFLPPYIDMVHSFEFFDHFGALEVEKVEKNLGHFLVGDIMSYEVPTVDMNLSLTGGLVKMFQHDLETIVVARGKKIIGFVTLNDVIEALGL